MRTQILTSPSYGSRAYERVAFRHADGAPTTLHVASFDRGSVRLRLRLVDRGLSLVNWCRATGTDDAVVAGFFVRENLTPLGELWINGRRRETVAFDHPWSEVRSALHVQGRAISMGTLAELSGIRGDLVQAGPLLVRDGAAVVTDGVDPEGFSAGARQFDSDITDGRYPRAALALAQDRVLAVVCDGRAEDDAGMTLGELAGALVGLGAESAINLDGGGSASLVYGGRLRNRPREEHGIEIVGGRPIATALVFEPAA